VSTDGSAVIPFESSRQRIRILADSTIHHFFSRENRESLGWIGFRRAFPKGGGIISISRVGLSRDRHWAIVNASSQSDWLAGASFLYVLHFDGSAWRVQRALMLWVS